MVSHSVNIVVKMEGVRSRRHSGKLRPKYQWLPGVLVLMYQNHQG